MYSPLKVGSFLDQRYHIRQVLRQGRWGWIYLAHDRLQSLSRTQSLDEGQSEFSRLQDHCVLEEWIVGSDRLEELQEVLHREFQKFNQIRNAQLPKYQVAFIHQQRLYCVREWIQGDSYRSLFRQRFAQGQPFLEAEVQQFLATLLPVLAILHKRDILHQHLTPDCILLRKSDRQPVLVEFGLQAELPIEFLNLEFFNHAAEGYAPLEQRLGERIAPDSDLYALAAIALVLLTGCEPEKLYDDKTQRWIWQPWISLSPQFAFILDRMLSPNPRRRYASANKVIQALRAAQQKDGLKNNVSTKDESTDVSALPTSPGTATQTLGDIALATMLIALAGIAAWRIIFHLQPTLFASSESPIVVSSTPELATQDATQTGSTEPSSKPADLKNRRRELAIQFDVFNQLVDELFYTKYPSLRNQSLDESQQSEWDSIASLLLDKLSSLSQEARANMGNYNRASYNTWLTAVKPLNVTGRSIEVLTDAQLVYLFPELQGKQINPRTLGQIWYAIAHDKISAVKNENKLKPISSKASRSEILNAGQGNLYTVQLQQGQNVRLSLKAPAGSLSLSIFPPSENASALLKNSTELQWSGKIEKSGIYEIVIASNTRKAMKYELKLDKDK